MEKLVKRTLNDGKEFPQWNLPSSNWDFFSSLLNSHKFIPEDDSLIEIIINFLKWLNVGKILISGK